MDTEKELEKAVEANAKSASKADLKADEALKYTQAALNAAHALHTMIDLPK